MIFRLAFDTSVNVCQLLLQYDAEQAFRFWVTYNMVIEWLSLLLLTDSSPLFHVFNEYDAVYVSTLVLLQIRP